MKGSEGPQFTDLVLVNAADANKVDDAATKPLVWPRTQDIIAAAVQVRLKLDEDASRQHIAVAAVAVAGVKVATDELFRPS